MTSEHPTIQTVRVGNRRDGELLRQYVETRSEAAFNELVRRYAGLVYATCLRETGDRTLAEDASQGVFLLLCRKASALQRNDTIAGWLYTAARYVAKNLVKQERRRLMHEARAAEEAMSAEESGNALWECIEPHLHDALDRLKPADRDAVLLRFVTEQSFAEVGSRLGLPENTARMRVSRAVEKIRTHLGSVGVAVSVGLLATLLEERAAQAAPERLLESLPHLAAGRGFPVLPDAVRRAIARAPLRPTAFRSSLLAVLGGALILFIGLIAYRRTLPPSLSTTQQRQLFARLSGVWKGTLEYADDATLQHFTYPTTVTLRTQNQGNDLQYTAAYEGSSSVDTTTISQNPKTGKLTVQNGGPQSSHRLSGVGELVRQRGGGYAFQGTSVALNAEVRLLILPLGHRLTLQEEYRKSGQLRYQFRNRFTLIRP